MPCICYVAKRFAPKTQAIIDQANDIIDDYRNQGLILTLRQLYYRFVALDLIPNKFSEYKRMGSIINDGRLAGEIDWEAIEDRTRSLKRISSWDDPGGIISSAAQSYAIDLWDNQEYRVEVWVEKDALGSVIEGAARPLGVPSFSCRGYTSQSEMWGAAQRFKEYEEDGQTPIIIHLGDHDPSGIDMTRDIRDRLRMFGVDMEVDRIALNMDQVTQYGPPPNPAKLTDSRARGYIIEFGDDSWELDALEPMVLKQLIEDAINVHCDKAKMKARRAKQEADRELLIHTSGYWEDVAEFVEEKVEEDNE